MWQGLSAQAAAAMQSTCVVATRAQVWNPQGTLEGDISYAVPDSGAGSVTENETASVRRTATLTLTDLSLVPVAPTDLLNPLTGNEIRLARGIVAPGAPQPEWVPHGVFRLSKPTIADNGSQLTIALTLNDRSSQIAIAKWTGPYTAAAGLPVGQAIQGIINSRWTGPPLQYNLAPSTVTVPTGTVLGVQFTSTGVQAETGSQGGGNNPWADCVQLALAAGCELFFDRAGVVVMRPVPEPGSSPTVATFAEGVGCTMSTATRALDSTKFYNGVIVVGTGASMANSGGGSSPAAPVSAAAWSTDPMLGPNGPLGARPDFIVDQTVSTVAEAQAVADAQLSLVMQTLESTSFSAVDFTTLDAGDQVQLTRGRMGMNSAYIVSTVVHPLDVATQMQVTNRAFSVAA